VDEDGDVDLVVQFNIQALTANGDLDGSTTALVLNGENAAALEIRGSDAVSIVP
jgi:hypothetical protein